MPLKLFSSRLHKSRSFQHIWLSVLFCLLQVIVKKAVWESVVGEGDIIFQNLSSTLALPTHSLFVNDCIPLYSHIHTITRTNEQAFRWSGKGHLCTTQRTRVPWSSILGDTQKSPGHNTGGLPVTRGMDKMTCRGHFQPQPFCSPVILWFHEGMPGISA